MKNFRASLFFLALVLITNLLARTDAKADATIRTVSESRTHPVGEAVRLLENVYDLPITYEDPPYVDESELSEHRSSGSLGAIRFSYELPPADATEEVRKTLAAKALADVLRSYDALRGSNGWFAVIEGNGGFHVVARRYIKSGRVQELRAVFDTPISLELKERNGSEALKEICGAASTPGQEIIIDWMHAGFQNDLVKASIGASNEPARSVLDRLITELPVTGEVRLDLCPSRYEGGSEPGVCYRDVPAHFSWQVRCNAGQCLLTTHVITPPGSFGGANAPIRP